MHFSKFPQLSLLGDVPALLNVSSDLLPTTINTVLTKGAVQQQERRCGALLPPGIVLATLAFLASRLVCIEGGRSRNGRLQRIVRDHAARIIQTRWRQRR